MNQRERANVDKVLVAKLGKVLLERNHDLTSEQYKLSRKLEIRGIKFVDHTCSLFKFSWTR